MENRVIPILILLMISVYVFGLEYRAQHQVPPEPTYQFYDTTIVRIRIQGPDTMHNAYGRLIDILEEGSRLIEAVAEGPNQFRLVFPLNGPRPATLYVDDLPFQVMLVPGDTSLIANLRWQADSQQIDSIWFEGHLQNICTYYLTKSSRINTQHIRRSFNTIQASNYPAYAAKLDSAAARELAFLAEQEVFSVLPQWFTDFEKNEILYQKAYLKRSAASMAGYSPTRHDPVKLDNSAAVFCYYYYLYLKTYIGELDSLAVLPPESDTTRQLPMIAGRHLAVASELLTGEPWDIYITQILYRMVKNGFTAEATSMLQQYEPTFSSARYSRFLWKEINNQKKKTD
ncbi:MAG: hypothetical protein SF053_06625 [Bacteroidia bacterium]|nr:hypothetical protein [Bacteroidia bacterium]